MAKTPVFEYPLRHGYTKPPLHTTVEAVQLHQVSWSADTPNWRALRPPLHHMGYTDEQMDRMTEEDIRQAFLTGHRIATIKVGGLVNTNEATIISIGVPGIIRAVIENRPQPRRAPAEVSIPVTLKEAREIFDYSDNRQLYDAIAKGRIAARYHSDRLIELDLKEIAERDPNRADRLVPHSA
jgi:hypothetical protein